MQEKNVSELLSKEKVTAAAINNNKKRHNLRRPRFGFNGKFVEVIGHTFIKSVTTNIGEQEDIHSQLNHFTLSTTSACGQPHFETMMNNYLLLIEDIP